MTIRGKVDQIGRPYPVDKAINDVLIYKKNNKTTLDFMTVTCNDYEFEGLNLKIGNDTYLIERQDLLNAINNSGVVMYRMKTIIERNKSDNN